MIGVLAYGSLITDPGEELAAVIVGEKRQVITPFAVEFARSSSKRFGAPTLVPIQNGGRPVLATLLKVSVDEQEALDIVYRREINAVGSQRTYSDPAPDKINAVRLDRFRNFQGFNLVICAALRPNIQNLSAEVLADLAIASARELRDGRDGISYLMNAKSCGVETELTAEYEAAVLKRTSTTSLSKALAAVHAEAPQHR